MPIQRALDGMPNGAGLPMIQVPAPTNKQNTLNAHVAVAANARQNRLELGASVALKERRTGPQYPTGRTRA